MDALLSSLQNIKQSLLALCTILCAAVWKPVPNRLAKKGRKYKRDLLNEATNVALPHTAVLVIDSRPAQI